MNKTVGSTEGTSLRVRELEVQLTRAEGEANALKGRVKVAEERLQTLAEEKSNSRKDEVAVGTKEEAYRRDIQHLKEQLKNAETLAVEKAERANESSKQVLELEKQLMQARAVIEESKKGLGGDEFRRSELQAQVHTTSQTADKYRIEAEANKERVKIVESRADQAEERARELETKLRGVEADLLGTKNKLSEANHRISMLEETTGESKAKYSSVESQTTQLQQDVSGWKLKAQQAQNRAEQLEHDVAGLKAITNQHQQQVEDYDRQSRALKNEKSKLEGMLLVCAITLIWHVRYQSN